MLNNKQITERMEELKGFFCYDMMHIKKSPKVHSCRFCLAPLHKRKTKFIGSFNYGRACKHCHKQFLKLIGGKYKRNWNYVLGRP